MTRKDDLTNEVASVFGTKWQVREGQVVPEAEDVRLGNDAVNMEAATVLYADLADSTPLVDNKKREFAAEVYKTFLLCAARIIRSQSGVITAYDGDRVTAVYIGRSKNTSAVKTALMIKWAVNNIIEPEMNKRWTGDYKIKHVVGVDTSSLFVVRTGIRGSNDLVWFGRAANHAAKMSSLSDMYSTYISADIYNNIADEAKCGGKDKRNMWTSSAWTEFDGRTIYGSNWQWRID